MMTQKDWLTVIAALTGVVAAALGRAASPPHGTHPGDQQHTAE
jgi:hypothetical protein